MKFCTKNFRRLHGHRKKFLVAMSSAFRISETAKRKWLMRANITAFIITLTIMQVSAASFAQNITIKQKDVSLEQFFREIKRQTGFNVSYSDQIINDSKRVDLNFNNTPLEIALTQVLDGQSLSFKIEDKDIMIKPKESTFLERVVATLTSINISGIVVDAENRPLPGASVRVKKTGRAVSTDANGKFFLRGVEEGAVLVVSFVGYLPREVSASANMGTILLEQSLSKLDEVMIQAYGTTTRRLTVGEISQVNGEDIARQAVSNPIQALEGMVPGMLVSPTTGYASGPVKLEIRGRKTLDPNLSSDPLFIIDGVPLIIPNVGLPNTGPGYQNGSPGWAQSGGYLNSMSIGQSPIFSLSPNDIESITVLKDAAATAMYGSRAANGVVLINTKKGKPGKTQVTTGIATSVKLVGGHFDVLNTNQYLQMRAEALRNDGITPTVTSAPDLVLWDNTRYTDWQKVLQNTVHSIDANASVSGGSNFFTYILGTSYGSIKDLTPVSKANQNQKATANLNLTATLSPKISIGLNTIYGYTRVNQIFQPNAFLLPPNAPPIFDKNGNLNFADWNAAGVGDTFGGIFSSLLSPNLRSTYFLNSGLSLSYQFNGKLNFKLNLGYNNAQSSSYSSVPIAGQNPLNNPTGSAIFGNNENVGTNINPDIHYNTPIGKGKLDLLIGATLNSNKAQSLTAIGTGYISDQLIKSLSNAQNLTNIQNATQNKYEDIHARVNYSWADKYVIEFTGNRDGSSSFGPGRQFGNFWSAGVNWILTEEKWLKQFLPSWITFMKLNCTYGTSGVSGYDYQYLSQWGAAGSAGALLYPYNGLLPLAPIHAVNQDYHWQTNRTLNASFDFNLLDDRIDLKVSTYRTRCNDQLTDLKTASFTGFSSVTANSLANVQNTGIEIALTGKIIDKKDFSWSFTLNASKNKNTLLDFPGIENSPYYLQYRIGQSINDIYLLHYLGIDAGSGQRVFEDYNKDGKITTPTGAIVPPPLSGINDAYIIINSVPKLIGGGLTRFTYKNLTVSFNFNFKAGIKVMSPYTDYPGRMVNVPPSVFNQHWQKPGDVSLNPFFSTVPPDSNFGFSDGAYVDCSFLRLQNINMNYALPDKWCRKLGVQGINLALSMQNIFTLTRYPGIDADTPFGTLPQPKTIDMRIGCSF